MPDVDETNSLNREQLIERLRQQQLENDILRGRLHSALSLTHDIVCCVEFESPVPTSLPVREQAALMLGGCIADCNEAYARLNGYASAAAVTGEHFVKLGGADDEDMLYRVERFVRSGYRVDNIENVERMQDGSVRHLINSSRGEVRDGCVVRAWVIARDVTMQRLLSSAGNETGGELCTAAEQVDSAFWIVDWTRFETLHVGSSVKQKWGLSRQQIMDDPLSWLQVVHPSDRQRVRDSFLTRAPVGTFDETFRVVLPGGDIRWIRDQAIPLPGADGKGLKVIGLAQDVTQIRETESGFRNLLQFSNDMLFVLSGQGILERCSSGMAKQLGVEQDELVGRPWVELLHADDRSMVLKHLSLAASGRPAVAVRCRFRRGDGDDLWVEWTSSPADEQARLFCVARDVSQQIQAEQQRVICDEAAERLAQLSPRERQVLQLVADGKPSKVIARELFLSARTVEKHRANLMKKLDVDSLAEAIRLVLQSSEAERDQGALPSEQ